MTDTVTPAITADLLSLPEDVIREKQAELLSTLSRYVRRRVEHVGHAAMIARSAADQRAEVTAPIDAWEAEQLASDHEAIAALDALIAPLAKALTRVDPKHRKTVETPAGDVSFREGSMRIEVTDRGAYMHWGLDRETRARDNYGWTRQPPTPDLEPNLRGIGCALSEGRIAVNDDGSLSLKGEDGERIPIPGVRQVQGEETLTVKPR